MIGLIARLAAARPKQMLIGLALCLPLFAVVGGGLEERLSVGGFLDPAAESSRVAEILEDDYGTGSYGFALVLVAIFAVHFQNGLFMSNNGYEFGLALLAASVSLLFSGAGKAALDNVLAKRFS